jgi:hypothetical protein
MIRSDSQPTDSAHVVGSCFTVSETLEKAAVSLRRCRIYSLYFKDDTFVGKPPARYFVKFLMIHWPTLGGSQKRERVVRLEPSHGGAPCTGSAQAWKLTKLTKLSLEFLWFVPEVSCFGRRNPTDQLSSGCRTLLVDDEFG